MLVDEIRQNIQVGLTATSWEDAIKCSAAKLLEKGKIDDSYVEGMIESVHKNGAYFVIVPHVAMPHTQSEGNVHETCISFTKFVEPIIFPGDIPAELFFCLAAEDSEGHMELISELAMLLMDDAVVTELLKVKTEEEVLNILA